MRDRIKKHKLTIRKISSKARKQDMCVRFDIGQPSFDTPEHVKEAARQKMDQKQTYTSVSGIDQLKRAIASEERIKDGFGSERKVQKENVMATVGGMEAIYAVMASRLSTEDQVLLNDPCWGPYKMMAKVNGNKFCQTPFFDQNGDLRQETREKIKDSEMMIVNTPSNPEGHMLSKSQAKEIAEVAEDYETYLLSDEVYHRLTYDAEHHSPAAFSEKSGVIGSVSKNHGMTGWRIGWIMDREENIAEYMKATRAITASPPKISQLAAVEALENDSHVEKMRSEYEERKQLMVEELEDIGLDFTHPCGAIYVFPEVGRDSMDFALEMVEKGVAVVPGEPMGPESDQNVRLCFGAATKEEIKKGVDILRENL